MTNNDRPGLSGVAQQALARMRSDLARLELCGHGVSRTKGRCSECEKPEIETKETA